METNGNTDAMLVRIDVLTSWRAMLDDTIWEHIVEARKAGISLRRISQASGISPTHLGRLLEEAHG